jgi:hypothetical protein
VFARAVLKTILSKDIRVRGLKFDESRVITYADQISNRTAATFGCSNPNIPPRGSSP